MFTSIAQHPDLEAAGAHMDDTTVRSLNGAGENHHSNAKSPEIVTSLRDFSTYTREDDEDTIGRQAHK